MKDKKYEFTDDILEFEYIGKYKLRRIRALKDFQTVDGKMVHKGDLGGWIENEKCLSHNGNCWVAGEAKVLGERNNGISVSFTKNGIVERKDSSRKLGDAIVSKNALISENAVVYCCRCITDNARVAGNADIAFSSVFDNAVVEGDADIGQHTYIGGNSHVFGHVGTYEAKIGGNAEVSGLTYLYGSNILDNAKVSGNHLTGCIVKDNVIIEDPLGKATDKPYVESIGYPNGTVNIEDCVFSGNVHVVGQPELCNSVFTDNAVIQGKVKVQNSKIIDNAIVEDKVEVIDNSIIAGQAHTSGHALIMRSELSGDVKVCGKAKLFSKASSGKEILEDGLHFGSSLISADTTVSMSVPVLYNFVKSNDYEKDNEKQDNLVKNIIEGKYNAEVSEDLAKLIYKSLEDDNFSKYDKHLSSLVLSETCCVKNGLLLDNPLFGTEYNGWIEDKTEIAPTKIPGLFTVMTESIDTEMDDMTDEFNVADRFCFLVAIDAKKVATDLELNYVANKQLQDVIEKKKSVSTSKSRSSSLKQKRPKKQNREQQQEVSL